MHFTKLPPTSIKAYLFYIGIVFIFFLISLLNIGYLYFYDYFSLKLYEVSGDKDLVRFHYWVFIPIYLVFVISIVFKVDHYILLSIFYSLLIGVTSCYYYKKKMIEKPKLLGLRYFFHFGLTLNMLVVYASSFIIIYAFAFATYMKILGIKK